MNGKIRKGRIYRHKRTKGIICPQDDYEVPLETLAEYEDITPEKKEHKHKP